jgi:predicted DNA-binding transcriptional regulator AlpA
MKPSTDPTNETETLLSAESLAAKLDCSLKHARNLIANGTLPKIKLGRRCVRTTLAAADAMIKRRTVTAAAK